jgi:uncharacterized protein YfdQ (DUF2303 family)
VIEDVRAILDAGAGTVPIASRMLAVPHPSDPNVLIPAAMVTGPGGASHVAFAKEILEALDARRPGPHRRSGTTKLTEVDSFIAFLKRWGGSQTVVYADTAALSLTAVLDDHPEGASTAWRQHRAVYSCPRAAEWLAWTGQADQPMSQTAFADWIEARLEDLAIGEGMPKPTELLTMARDLTIRTKGTFERRVNPTTGDFTLVNKNETEVGSTVIPRAFLVAIPCFEGGDRYRIEARVRFTLDGGPRFTFTLHRAKEIERDAFGEVRARVARLGEPASADGQPAQPGTLTVLAGTP